MSTHHQRGESLDRLGAVMLASGYDKRT